MKKKIMIILILLLLATSLFAQLSETFIFTAQVPDDYGIYIPKDAVKIDRIVFELSDKGKNEIVTNRNITTDFIEVGGNSISLKLLYYGNLSEEYKVKLITDVGNGWILSDNQGQVFIPMKVDFNISEDPNSDIEMDKISENGIILTVPPSGPKRGEEIASIDLLWDGSLDLRSGRYTALLNLALEAL